MARKATNPNETPAQKFKRFAFISRHVPTDDQHRLAAEHPLSITLVHVGDVDAFSLTLDADIIRLAGGSAGIVCVHPLVALAASRLGYQVGVFQNANRAPEGAKPEFAAVSLAVVGFTGVPDLRVLSAQAGQEKGKDRENGTNCTDLL